MRKGLFKLFVLIALATGIMPNSVVSWAGPRPEVSELQIQWEQLYDETVEAYRAGDYRRSVEIAEQALEFAAKAFGYEQQHTLTSLDWLVLVYEREGRSSDIEGVYRGALADCHVSGCQQHPNILEIESKLAWLYSSQGRFAEAEPLHLHSLSARKSLLGGADNSTITSISNLAAHYELQGRFDAAELLYLEALNVLQINGNQESASFFLITNNLGWLHLKQNRYGVAEELFEKALSGQKEMLGSEHPLTLFTANNLGLVYERQGRYQEAETLLIATLNVRERVLGSSHPDVLHSLNFLGDLYVSQGRLSEASSLRLRSIVDGKQILNDSHVEMATYYGAYARLLSSYSGTPTSAIFFQKKAINILQGIRQNIGRISAGAQEDFLRQSREDYEILQQWLIEAGRFAEAEQVGRMLKEEEYYDFIRRNATEGDDPRQTRSELTAREAEWETQLAAWSERPNRVATELAVLKDRQRGGAELTTLEINQLGDLEAEYEIAYAAYKDNIDNWLSEVRALSDDAIQEEAGALEAKFHDDLQQEIAEIGDDVAALQVVAFEDSLHFFLITPGAFKHVETEVSRADLYEAVFETRKALGESTPDTRNGGPAGGPGAGADELTASLQTLYDILLAPVRQELEDAGTETLMLNLQGPIRYAPFAALHDGERYMTERFGLALFTPAARTRYETSGALRAATGFGVSKKHEGFSPLPAVARELERLLPGEDEAGILTGKVYMDEAFTRDALEAELEERSPILHIASHFSMRPGDDTNSFLLLGDGTQLTLADINSSSKLRFRGVELMTLSACSTALSSEGTGVEVEGFGVLAQAKGAEAVVATLWNVADDATATFMENFYGGLSTGELDKAKALQAAQVTMITDPETAHPYYWAPYILMGNWK